MAMSFKAFGKMADFLTIETTRCAVGFMFEAKYFYQKPSPRPAVRDTPHAIYRTNAINSDKLLSTAQWAPEVF